MIYYGNMRLNVKREMDRINKMKNQKSLFSFFTNTYLKSNKKGSTKKPKRTKKSSTKKPKSAKKSSTKKGSTKKPKSSKIQNKVDPLEKIKKDNKYKTI